MRKKPAMTGGGEIIRTAPLQGKVRIRNIKTKAIQDVFPVDAREIINMNPEWELDIPTPPKSMKVDAGALKTGAAAPVSEEEGEEGEGEEGGETPEGEEEEPEEEKKSKGANKSRRKP